MSGFTYNGIHSSTFSVEYIPDAAARWFDDAEFEVYKNDVAWKNGGYIYGKAAEIREIDISCYFEEIDIATRENIRKWLGRKTSGKLVFDDRPFVYYNVTPAKIVQGKIYNDTAETFSGTFTVKFYAADPFGYLTRKSNAGTENDGAENYCGIIATSMMPAAPTTSGRTFNVYNPGTETCGLTIRISGTESKHFRFMNARNDTVCELVSLPSSLVLDINGDTGLVTTYASGTPGNSENGFAYHDHGVVRLEPDVTYYNVPYTATSNGSAYDIVPSNIVVDESMINAKIQFTSPSTRTATVTAVNKDANKLTCTLGGSGTFQTTGTMRISTQNKITITEKNNSGNWVTPSSLSVTSIAIDYNPRLL